LKPVAAAVTEARKLAKLPAGHFTLIYTPDFLSTLVPDIQHARDAAWLLELDVWLRAQQGDLQGAWVSAQAMLNSGRAIGDEPMLVPQLVRMAIGVRTVAQLERILAQGEVPAPLLVEMRKELAKEAAEHLFRIGMRGERAGMHQLMENAASGKVAVNLSLLGGLAGAKSVPPPSLFDELFPKTTIPASHVWLLRNLTKAVEASTLAPADQDRVLKEIEAASKTAPALARIVCAAVSKVAAAECRQDTLLACAGAALAAEEFRLRRQRWPGSLDELVKAGHLEVLPMDLYDGKPLRFRPTPDGLVIYSVGADGNYRGQALDNLAAFDPNAMRVEFRLWNVERRRQPAAGRVEK
jgi:hypothetical protein